MEQDMHKWGSCIISAQIEQIEQTTDLTTSATLLLIFQQWMAGIKLKKKNHAKDCKEIGMV